MKFGVRLVWSFCVVLIIHQRSLLAKPRVPCFFIFGDSLVDNGNNNNLTTLAKVNYLPYGIDFPQGPTGRFTNGLNIADFLAKYIGFNTPIPPFASSQFDEDILRGLNYASGSSGIRDETGEQQGDRVFLNKQLLHHNFTVSRITQLLGSIDAAQAHLSKCLYYFNIGSNDYLNNYFRPEYYNTSKMYNTDEYATVLMEQYSQQLRTLYNLGSRKIAVSGVGPLGCIPAETSHGTGCNESKNAAVKLFNEKLKVLIDNMNAEFGDARYVAVGTSGLLPDIVAKLISSKPCCTVSKLTGLCEPGQSQCTFRELYAFFDNYHPTQIVNGVLGLDAFMEMLVFFHPHFHLRQNHHIN